MIIPYYNSIICAYSIQHLSIDEDEQQLIKQSLHAFLKENTNITDHIFIKVRQIQSEKNNMAFHFKHQLQKMMVTLGVPLYHFNNSYTMKQSQWEYINALQCLQIEWKDNKSPIVLKNMTRLQAYFKKHKDESCLKQFLKQLLIEEIDYNKKKIRYNTRQQVCTKIRHLIDNMKGNISISQQSNLYFHQHQKKISSQSNQNCFQFILINSNLIQDINLFKLIQSIASQVTINNNVNTFITNSSTLPLLRHIAQQQLSLFFTNTYTKHCLMIKSSIIQLKKQMKLISYLRVIVREGMRLAQLQRQQRQQFLLFVQEMNMKYTKECRRYLHSFNQQIQYMHLRQKYFKKQSNITTIGKYLSGLNERIGFKKEQKKMKDNECIKVQKRIISFLLNRRLYRNMNQVYLRQKQEQKRANTESYNRIIQFSNQYQLQKYHHFNSFKYGFSAYLQILEINNHHNEQIYSPQHLLNLLERVNKYQEPIVKVKCQPNSIHIYNIQGRVFTLQNSRYSTQRTPYSTFNKQNYQNQMNTFGSTSKENESIKLKRSFSQKSSLYQSKHSEILLPKKNNESIIKGNDYELRIEESGKIYGKGCNKYGQLGLGNRKNILSWTFITQNIKLLITYNYHTLAVTKDNKIIHFGRQLLKLQQCDEPTEYKISQRLMIKELMTSANEIYVLTEANKLFSLFKQKYIRIPKQVQLQLEHFHLVQTSHVDIEIIYLIGYWTNTLDKVKRHKIKQYLLSSNKSFKSLHLDNHNETFLMDKDQIPSCNQHKPLHINELSSILEQMQ